MSFLFRMIGGIDPTLPYSKIDGEEIRAYENNNGKWKMYNGVSKDGKPASVFKVEEPRTEVSGNALKRAKTLRHPSILTFVDGVQRENDTIIVTERAIPLVQWYHQQESVRKDVVLLGFSQILEGLKFLNMDCNLSHGNITASSVFVAESGDWKLGGLDLTSEYRSDGGVPHLWTVNPRYVPAKMQDPERSAGRRAATPWSSDVWSFASMISETIGSSELPAIVRQCCAKMMDRNARRRPSPKKILAQKFFAEDPLVSVVRELQNWALLDAGQQVAFFKKVNPLIETFPKATCRHRLLPVLLESIRVAEKSSDASASLALAPVLSIGKDLNEEDFNELVVPPVVRLFSSNNRATRLQLLKHAEIVVPKIPQKVVNESIFRDIQSGFGDSVPALREWTIRSMIHIVPLLTDVNKEKMLGHFRRLVRDPLPPIRNNVVVCLIHIAKHLSSKTRSLLQLFAAGLRDPVPRLRHAALDGLSQIGRTIEPAIRARSVLPMVVTLVVDPDSGVRSAAHKVCQSYLSALRDYKPPTPKVAEGTTSAASKPGGKTTSSSSISTGASAHIGTLNISKERKAGFAISSSREGRAQQKNGGAKRRDRTPPRKSSSSSLSIRENRVDSRDFDSSDFFSNWGEEEEDGGEDVKIVTSPPQVSRAKRIEADKERKKAERRERAAARREEMRRKREKRRQEKIVTSSVGSGAKGGGWDDGFMSDGDEDLPAIKQVTPSKSTRISGMKLSSGGSRKKSTRGSKKKLTSMRSASNGDASSRRSKSRSGIYADFSDGDDDDDNAVGDGAWGDWG
eukprot:g5128.t1